MRETRLASRSLARQKAAERPLEFESDKTIFQPKIVIPIVQSSRREYIPVDFVGANTIISNKAFQLPSTSLFLFAMLETKMHMAWLKTVGGRLKIDFSYSNTLVYNTFVFPKVSEHEKQKIEVIAQRLLDKRNDYKLQGNTLADLYDPLVMPSDLRKIHHELDKSVELLYSKEPFENDNERVEHLIKLYQKEVAKQNGVNSIK